VETCSWPYHSFVAKPINVHLTLSTDGVNTFKLSRLVWFTWHVLLLNYNIPPWLTTKKKNHFVLIIYSMQIVSHIRGVWCIFRTIGWRVAIIMVWSSMLSCPQAHGIKEFYSERNLSLDNSWFPWLWHNGKNGISRLCCMSYMWPKFPGWTLCKVRQTYIYSNEEMVDIKAPIQVNMNEISFWWANWNT